MKLRQDPSRWELVPFESTTWTPSPEPSIERKMLERDGMVERTVRATSPPQVDYVLTELGRSLSEPVRQLAQWALAHLQTVHDHRLRYDANL